jgi:hypothetical protein
MQFGTENSIQCDPEVVYDQNHDRRATFGVITSLHIGKHEIKSKWKEKCPATHKKETIVVVLKSFSWDLGQANPMIFTGYCSPHVRKEILGLLGGKLKDSSVRLKFHVYKYDEVKEKEKGSHGGYYESRWAKHDVHGYFPTDFNNSMKLKVNAATEAEPQRCYVELHVMPAAGHENHIHVAEEEGQKHALPFGHKHD